MYFAGLTDISKTRSESFILPQNLQIKQLIDFLKVSRPEFASESASTLLSTCACAVNMEYVDLDEDETVIQSGDECALIPPVSGG